MTVNAVPQPIASRRSRRATSAVAPILVSLIYYAGAEAAFAMGTLTQMFAPFWPPNVVLLCALLLAPERRWWLYVLAVFPAHVAAELGVGMPVPQLLVAFACNIAVALLNAIALRRLRLGPPWLDGLRNTSLYLLITVVLSPGAVAFVGGIEPMLGGGETTQYWVYWWRWYLSNALGSLTLTPVFLIWFGDGIRWPTLVPRHRLIEAAALTFGLAAACTIALGAPMEATADSLLPALFYAPVPLLLWAAVRFGGRGASGAVLLVTVLSIWHVMQGQGPFAAGPPGHSVLPLQLFLAVISAPIILVAALVQELHRTNGRLTAVLGGISDCYYTLDRDWRFTAINPKAAAWFGGASADELVGRSYEEGHKYAAAGVSCIRRAMEEGVPGHAEFASAAQPGRWVDLHAYPSAEGVSVFYRDITERKSRELALRLNNKRLQLAHEAAGIGTWEWDVAGNEVYWSAEQYRLFGRDPDAEGTVHYDEWRRTLHPEDWDRVEAQALAFLKTRRPFAIEYRVVRDGEVRWMLGRGKVIRDEAGRPERIIGINLDITERKHAEEALRASEARFRAMAETVPDIIFTSSPEGGCEYLSPRFYEYTGLAPGATQGLGWADALHPDDRERVLASRRRGGQSGEAFEEECRFRAADGSYRWFVARWRPIHDATGQTVKWFGAISDIDALKRTEDELRRSNERLGRLLAQMTEYQYSIDREWRIIECNAVSAACAHSTPEQLIGRGIWEVMPNACGGEVERQFRRALEERMPAHFECRSPLHPEMWQEFHVHPIPEGISVFATDITKRKSAELSMRATQELLQSSLDALSAHVAVLDGEARVMAVNSAWRRFAAANGCEGQSDGIGRHYLDVCEAARPSRREIQAIALGLRVVMLGERDEFRTEYPCHGAGETGWFQLRITRFGDGAARRLVVAHEGITEVKQAEEELRRVTGRLLQVQDEERRRIARELHDSTAQNLAGASLGVDLALQLVPRMPIQAKNALRESGDLIEQSQREIRTVSYLLHPPMLDEAGLPTAIHWYVTGFSKRSGIAVDLDVSPELSGRRLPTEVETALFRVVQEGLTNVHRHSNSATARIRLAQAEPDETASGDIVLSIEDDGSGMGDTLADDGVGVGPQPANRVGSLGVGVAGMRQRLGQLGGQLEIRSSGSGTIVRATVPCGTCVGEAGVAPVARMK